jgi:uncharacterized membrane protein YraQ (UPF0718 family)
MQVFDNKKFQKSVQKTLKGILDMLPILAGVILLVSMINVLIPKSFYQKLFTGNSIKDSVIGSMLGSILTGNPITAYILGNDFIKNGVGITAVAAFIVAWTTVGIVQLPAESLMLGKRFALYRNLTAFLLSVLVAIISTSILSYI